SPPGTTVFPYTTLFRSRGTRLVAAGVVGISPVALLSKAMFAGCMRNLMNCEAPCDACCGQVALIPHSQDPPPIFGPLPKSTEGRSEEHTSELQSLAYLV